MKIESDRNTYLLYKYPFLFGFIVTVLVFLIMITGLGAANEGTTDAIFSILFGFSSLGFFLFLRKKFVRVSLDHEQFEILNSEAKGVYSWEEIKEVEHFSGLIFRFKRKQDDTYFYSLYDFPKEFPVWRPDRTNRLKTEISALLQEKKKELNI